MCVNKLNIYREFGLKPITNILRLLFAISYTSSLIFFSVNQDEILEATKCLWTKYPNQMSLRHSVLILFFLILKNTFLNKQSSKYCQSEARSFSGCQDYEMNPFNRADVVIVRLSGQVMLLVCVKFQ